MSASTIPPGGLSLVGLSDAIGSPTTDSRTAVLLSCSDALLKLLKDASADPRGLQLVTGGKAPKIRLGDRSIALHLSPEKFRTELFTCKSSKELAFNGVVSHHASVDTHVPSTGTETAGADAALAALQNSMALYEQGKQATQTQVADSVLPIPKNRFDAARQQKRGLLGVNHHSHPSSPSLAATASPVLAPTSTFDDASLKTRAYRIALVHLLAMGPVSTSDIAKKTHIPRIGLESILQNIGQQNEGKWKLSDKTFKELDVWTVRYGSKGDRQLAVDNAVKAYDRLRLSKDDKLWQLLLPKDERGKGKVLSRLHLGAGQGLSPYVASPNPHHTSGKNTSAANTPRLGPSSTPNLGATKSFGGDVMKRLLSKDPKKARAAEEAKEKKRKDRQATPNDHEARPAKRPATGTSKKSSQTAKSAEFVHSSDDDTDEAEAILRAAKAKPRPKDATPKPHASSHMHSAHAASPSSIGHVKASQSSTHSDAAVKPQGSTRTGSPAVKPSKSVLGGKTSPHQVSGLSAPSPQQRPQLSPSKSGTLPTIPSPLGAARSRVASDVSDRSGIGFQKTKTRVDNPKGLGITTAPRKRHDTVTSTESLPHSGSERKQGREPAAETTAKPTDTPEVRAPSGTAPQPSGTHKRKADSMATPRHDSQAANKHRKTASTSSQSQQQLTSSTSTLDNSTARTSPDERFDGGSSDTSSASVVDNITFTQGVSLAQKFQDQYYPQYAKMYDSMAERQASGERIGKAEKDKLWEMHERLNQMKREIEAASRREHGGGES